MELRSEPRFHVSAPAKLIPLDPERSEIPSVLVDVSATGMRAVVDSPLPAGETVLVELEDHLILAETRYTQERGDKYSLGLRRVHEMMKSALPQSRIERLEKILEGLPEYSENGESLEYLREKIANIVRKPEPVAAPVPEPEIAALQPSPEPEPVAAPEPSPVAIVPQLERTEPVVHSPEPEHLEPEPVAAAPYEPPAIPAPEREPELSAAEPGVDERTNFNPRAAAPFEPLPVPAPVAQEEELPQRSWRVPVALAAGFVVAVGIAFGVLHSRSRAQSSAPMVIETATVPKVVISSPAAPAPEQPSAPPVVAKPSPAPEKPVAAKPAEAAPAVKPGMHRAQLKVTISSWISASADGVPLFAKLLQAGETREIDFQKLSYIHLGKAAGVELTLDGKPCTISPGRALRLVKLEPGGMHVVPWHDADPVEP